MSMKIFKKILMLLAVLMMVVTPFAAITADTTSSSSSADTAKTTDDSLKKVKEKGTLVVPIIHLTNLLLSKMARLNMSELIFKLLRNLLKI